MDKLISFFLSPNSQSIVTIIVGSFAFFIWKLKSKTEKRMKAKIIVNEVRSAEDTIRDILKIREGKVGFGDFPNFVFSNTWFDNSHLFIDDLSQDEFKEINEFFSLCRKLNEEVSRDNSFLWIGVSEIAKNYIKESFKFAKDELPDDDLDDFKKNKEYIEKFEHFQKKLAAISASCQFYFPGKTLTSIKNRLSDLDRFYNLSARNSVNKIRETSEKKIFFIF